MAAEAVVTSYPFDAGANSQMLEAQWNRAMRIIGTGVVLGRLNELSVYADGTAGPEGPLGIKVRSGEAWLEGTFVGSDDEEALDIAANASGLARIDRVVLEVDWTLNTSYLRVLTGTPAASPAAPTLTRIENGLASAKWQISLARVAVANGAASIIAGNVTDERSDTTVCGFVTTGTAGGTGFAGIQVQDTSATADTTTASTTLVDLANATVTLTTTGGSLVVDFGFSVQSANSTRTVEIAFVLDAGTAVVIGQHTIRSSNLPERMTAHHRFTGVSAGAHTVKVQWRTTVATTLTAKVRRYLRITEVP